MRCKGSQVILFRSPTFRFSDTVTEKIKLAKVGECGQPAPQSHIKKERKICSR